MRLHKICIAYCLLLTGCVNYAGMHEHTIPLNDSMLSTSHNSHRSANTANPNWWQHFHDPVLNKLVATALADSPTIQIAQSRVAEAAHMAKQAGAALWPTVDAYAAISRERISANSIYPPPYGGNRYTETNFGLNFQYEFDFWGKNRQTLAAKISEKNAAEADYAEARLILATAVANQYFQLQYKIAALKIAEAILHERRSLFDIIKVQASQGTQSDIPLSYTRAYVEATKMQVTALTEQIKLAQHQLVALLGKNPLATEIQANALNYQKNSVAFPKILPANLLGSRPDIIASRARIEAAAHNVNAAKARFYPNINLMALLSLQSYSLPEAFYSSSRDNSIGAAFDLPIFDAGARRANLAIQFDEYDVASEQYNQTILNALQDVADQAATLQSLRGQLTEQNTAVHAAERGYQLTVTQYHHGITDYMHVLTTQDVLLQEQNKLIQLEAQQLKTTVLMMKALGGNYPQEG